MKDEKELRIENYFDLSTKVSAAPLLHLSQGHLNLLSACPRKFQHTFLEQLGSPNPPDQRERQNQGARFHLLLQQWQLDLPIAPLVQEDAQLEQWFRAFEAAAPEILAIAPAAEALRQTECDRSLEFQGYLLTARYDLLLSTAEQAKILDWKTYPRPQTSRWLAQNWQTRLYPFVLAETSPYAPAQISMIYWFFQSTNRHSTDAPQEPQSLDFPYSDRQHEQTRQDLTVLLNQLTSWLADYQTGKLFPQLGIANGHCAACSFATRCFGDRPPDTADADHSQPLLPTHLPSLSAIPEISL